MSNFPSDDNTEFKIHLLPDVYKQLRTRIALGLFEGEIDYTQSDVPTGSSLRLELVTYDDLVALGMNEDVLPKMEYNMATGMLHYDLT